LDCKRVSGSCGFCNYLPVTFP